MFEIYLKGGVVMKKEKVTQNEQLKKYKNKVDKIENYINFFR